MAVRSAHAKAKTNWINIMVFLCAFLSSMVPRYISTFKLRLGINVSFYTIIVVLTYILLVHRFVIFKKIQSSFIPIWFLFVLLSVWKAEQFGEWAYYLVWTLTSVLFAQILYCSDRTEVFNSLIKGLLCGLMIHLIVGLIEISTHHYFFAVSIDNRRYYGNVPVSIFVNPNDYVTFVVTMFPFAISYMMKQQSLLKKAYYAIMVILSVYLMIMSMSRSAFFAMVLLTVTLIWLAYKKSNQNKLSIIIGAIVLIGIGFAVPQFRARIISVFSTNQMDIAGTDKARWNLIKNGFYFLRVTYGTGIGAGNMRNWLSNRAIYSTGGLLFIHNWYVELLATFGIVFFLLYIVFHAKIIITLIKKYEPKNQFWNLDNTVLTSFIGFSIVSIASSSNIYSEWIWMYLVFVATYSLFREIDKTKQVFS